MTGTYFRRYAAWITTHSKVVIVGVLALALSPPLRRFGIVTESAIIFAFVAVLTILPCLLVVRERLAGRLDRE